MVPTYDYESPSLRLPKTRQNKENLQQKLSSCSNSHSKIPVKNRQVSVPIEPLDESALGNVKRSSIPRITSSPLLATSLDNRKSLTPIVNKDLNVTTPKHLKHEDKLVSPPSTVSKLAHQLSSLSLNTPIRKKSKVSLETKSPVDNTMKGSRTKKQDHATHKHEGKKVDKTIDKSQTIGINTKNQESQTRNLGNRTSQLLKDRIRSHDVPASHSPLSPPKVRRDVPRSKTLRSISIDSPVSKFSSISKQSTVATEQSSMNNRQVSRSKKDQSDESPLLARLTRSTTASNLKSATKLSKSSTISDLNLKMRSVSNITPTTRKASTSRFGLNSLPTHEEDPRAKIRAKKHSKLSTSDQPKAETIVLPKRKSNMTKSFSVNAELKMVGTLSSQPQALHSKRLPSLQRSRVFSRNEERPVGAGQNKRIKSVSELRNCLFSSSKTKSILEAENKQSIDIEEPQDPFEVIENNTLTSYEKAEVLKIDEVFYVGQRRFESSSQHDFTNNFGFDDKDKNLIVEVGDHINYRYQIIAKLGKGMFGNVVKCRDHKLRRDVSVKIMKNDVKWSLQCINEIKILKKMKHPNLLTYFGHLNFRSHICISTELLAVNLYEALEATKFKGFDLKIIKKWSKDILSGLTFIHKAGFVHADLKPENIMLVSPNSLNVKIIDFGSSSAIGDVSYPYIQSRYYRAPEILLGCRYNEKIDIWSFATLIYELYDGNPLFGAKNETQLLNMMTKLIGVPSPDIVISLRDEIFEHGSINKHGDTKFIDKKVFIFTKFDELGKYKGTGIEQKSTEKSFNIQLKMDDPLFGDFLYTALNWNYNERPTAESLLNHKFIIS